MIILLPTTNSKNQKHTRKEEKEEIVAQKKTRVEQTVEDTRETAINTGVKGQLEEQSGPRKKTSPLTLLENTLNFSALDFLPAPLPVKAKKGRKKSKTGNEKKEPQILNTKETKKTRPGKVEIQLWVLQQYRKMMDKKDGC